MSEANGVAPVAPTSPPITTWTDGWQACGRGLRGGVESIKMVCPGGHFKYVRVDTFLPGAHCLVCVECGHSGSAVRLEDGSTYRVTKQARAASTSA